MAVINAGAAQPRAVFQIDATDSGPNPFTSFVESYLARRMPISMRLLEAQLAASDPAAKNALLADLAKQQADLAKQLPMLMNKQADLATEAWRALGTAGKNQADLAASGQELVTGIASAQSAPAAANINAYNDTQNRNSDRLLTLATEGNFRSNPELAEAVSIYERKALEAQQQLSLAYTTLRANGGDVATRAAVAKSVQATVMELERAYADTQNFLVSRTSPSDSMLVGSAKTELERLTRQAIPPLPPGNGNQQAVETQARSVMSDLAEITTGGLPGGDGGGAGSGTAWGAGGIQQTDQGFPQPSGPGTRPYGGGGGGGQDPLNPTPYVSGVSPNKEALERYYKDNAAATETARRTAELAYGVLEQQDPGGFESSAAKTYGYDPVADQIRRMGDLQDYIRDQQSPYGMPGDPFPGFDSGGRTDREFSRRAVFTAPASPPPPAAVGNPGPPPVPPLMVYSPTFRPPSLAGAYAANGDPLREAFLRETGLTDGQ